MTTFDATRALELADERAQYYMNDEVGTLLRAAVAETHDRAIELQRAMDQRDRLVAESEKLQALRNSEFDHHTRTLRELVLARAVVEAAKGMKQHGSDYRNGTHANIL